MKPWTSARVLVVGDVMLDHYVRGEARGLSAEAPVPVVDVLADEYHLGGAGNVAASVAAFAASTALVGVVGTEPAAGRLYKLAASAGVETYGLVRDPYRTTTEKRRIFVGQHQVAREDRGTQRRLDPRIEERVVEKIRRLAGDLVFDAVIVSDYDKGVMSRKVIEAALEVGPSVVDPKVKSFHGYWGATVFKPNVHEFEKGMGERPVLTDVWMEAARERLGVEHLVVTLGPRGIAVKSPEKNTWVDATKAKEVFDVSGAGDTVAAILGLSLATDTPIERAVQLANLAAGVVISRPGTSVAKAEDLREAEEFRPSVASYPGE